MLIRRAMRIAALGPALLCVCPLASAVPAQTSSTDGASFAPAWRVTLEDESAEHVVAAAGAVLTAGAEVVVARASDDGRELWRRSWPSARAPLADSSLVVVSGARVACALDPASGTERWRADLPEDVVEMAIAGDRWVARDTTTLYAWNLQGEPSWKLPIDAGITTMVGAGAQLIVGSKAPEMLVVDGRTGQVSARIPLDAAIERLDADATRAFFSTAHGRIASAQYRPSARREWQHDAVRVRAIGAPATDGDLAFFALFDNTVSAFDRLGGSRRWVRAVPSRPATGPRVAAQSVLVPLVTGELVELGAANGIVRSPARSADAPAERFQDWAMRADGPPAAYVLTVMSDGSRALTAWRRPAKAAGSALLSQASSLANETAGAAGRAKRRY